eukprot:TCALIF_09845-PA protein Name:"Protein of unknown function" AED:0.48 eAED:0.51 QI:0/-1/0/1/-1/1/1/0/315
MTSQDTLIIQAVKADVAKMEVRYISSLRENLAGFCEEMDIEEAGMSNDVTKFKRVMAGLVQFEKCEIKIKRLVAMSSSDPQHKTRLSKVNNTLKPSELSLDKSSLGEFTMWKKAFKIYYSSNAMSEYDTVEQQGYFSNCVQLSLQHRLNAEIQDDMPIFGDGSCMKALEMVFVEHIPTLTRLVSFFTCHQKQGESFNDWYLRLRMEGEEADPTNSTVEKIDVLRICTGVYEKLLRKECLRQSNKDDVNKMPTKDQLISIGRTWQRADRVESSIAGNSMVNAAETSSYKAKKKGVSQPLKDNTSCKNCNRFTNRKP